MRSNCRQGRRRHLFGHAWQPGALKVELHATQAERPNGLQSGLRVRPAERFSKNTQLHHGNFGSRIVNCELNLKERTSPTHPRRHSTNDAENTFTGLGSEFRVPPNPQSAIRNPKIPPPRSSAASV